MSSIVAICYPSIRDLWMREKEIVMRIALLGLLLLAGCSAEPKFKDEREEARYLMSVTNPTVEQFRRKEELAPVYAKMEADRRALKAFNDAKYGEGNGPPAIVP